LRKQAFPIAYLPPIDYLAHFLAAPNPVIDIYEHWPKRTLRNRAEITSPKGRYMLSVPVSKDKHHTPAKNVRISYREKWQVNHWRAIKSFYSNSPFFLFYEQDIKYFFEHNYDRIIDLNLELMKTLLELLNINKEVPASYAYIEKNEISHDLREYFNHTKDTVLVPKYIQVFEDRQPFLHNLSILDLLFNLGPEAETYLENLADKLSRRYSG